jgi:hypothetical protein
MEPAVGSDMRTLLLVLVFALSAGRLLSADEPLIDPTDAPTYVGQMTDGNFLLTELSTRTNTASRFSDYAHTIDCGH